MTAKRGPPERLSLSRWSRRKLAAAKATPSPATTAPAPGIAPAAPAPLELPPVESLTFESDFTAFLRPEVDDKVRRAALKQLFRDPRFNVMDGLDTYIDDYTRADPIPPDVLADLLQRGFGRAPEAGLEAAAVPAPPTGTAVTGETQPAIPAGSEQAATLPHPPLSPARGGEGARAERSAGEGDIASARTPARDGEPTNAKPAENKE